MDIQIISEKENPLLKRKEILASIDYQGGSTPSKADLQKTLAEHFNANIENVEISKIISEVGLSKGRVWIKIWQEKKIPIYAELKKEKKKEEKKPEPPEPEESKEEIKPEKPKVEEPKVEEKPKEQKSEEPKEQKKPEEKREEQPKQEEKKE